MLHSHLAILVAALIGVSASPYPLANSSSCTNGQLVCSSDGSQYGLCSWGKVTFQPVAPGTACRGGAIVASSIGTGASATAEQSSSTAAVSSSSHATATTTLPSVVSVPASSSANVSIPEYTTQSSIVSVTASTTLPSAVSVPTSSASTSSTSSTATSTSGGEDYHVYLGNGEPSEGWPTLADWAAFDDMWSTNLDNVIKGGCASFSQAENTAQNNADLKAAILAEGNSTGIDPRFILAIVLQESLGCVRVQTTIGSVHNPGLMQSHDGNSTCYQCADCPASEIQGMIHDGVQGTSSGPGLMQLIKQVDTKGVAKYYRAARMYNSGSIASNGLLQCGIATNAYCSDIANRVTLAWYKGLSTFPTDACTEGDS